MVQKPANEVWRLLKRLFAGGTCTIGHLLEKTEEGGKSRTYKLLQCSERDHSLSVQINDCNDSDSRIGRIETIQVKRVTTATSRSAGGSITNSCGSFVTQKICFSRVVAASELASCRSTIRRRFAEWQRQAGAHGLDDLYYGSTRINMRRAEGEFVQYTHAFAKADDTGDAVRAVLLRACVKPLPGRPHDGLQPCIPSLDIRIQHAPTPAANVPGMLAKPLIKVSSGEGNVSAVASGVRSALVRVQGRWYRLKGCGNNFDGFVLRQVGQRKPGEKPVAEIRGCAFKHTAMRALFVTEMLRRQHPLYFCNSARGYFLYSHAAHLPLGRSLPTACVVMATRGDRRLRSHVLRGLDLLLPHLLAPAPLKNTTALTNVFPAGRPTDDGEPLTTAQLMFDHFFAKANEWTDIAAGRTATPLSHGDEWNVPRNFLCFANALEVSLPEVCPPPEKIPKIDASWQLRWRTDCRTLTDALRRLRSRKCGRTCAKNGFVPAHSVLAYTFSRLGLDCGRIMRTLHHEAGMSWGTYTDALCAGRDQFHCNAHGNNVVLIDPRVSTGQTAESRPLVAALDFDMAFTAETYVDIRSGRVGLSAMQMRRLCSFESASFLDSIASGGRSSGTEAGDTAAFMSRLPRGYQLVQQLLYDTFMLGYFRAYSGDERYHAAAPDEALHRAADALMRLAVMMCADVVA